MTRPLLLLLCSCTSYSLQYRVVFRDVHAAFRSEDIHSAAHDLGGSVEHVSATSARLHLPDDTAAATLAERSVLVRYVLEEWGAGATLRDAVSRARIPSDGPLANGASWRIRVQSPGRRTGLVNAHGPILLELGGLLDALPGPVRLKNAEEDVAVLLRGETVVVGRVVARGCAAELLSQSWSCVELQCFHHRSIARRYRVADRCYRGSTTMDAALAFVTASFARVRRGDLVLDPFCGAPAESFVLRATSSVRCRRRDDSAQARAGTSWLPVTCPGAPASAPTPTRGRCCAARRIVKMAP